MCQVGRGEVSSVDHPQAMPTRSADRLICKGESAPSAMMKSERRWKCQYGLG